MKTRRRRRRRVNLGDVTQKDFIAFAKILKSENAPCPLVHRITEYFGSQNPRFDNKRFMAAVGICGR